MGVAAAHEISQGLRLHISESLCHERHASFAMRKPPLVAIPMSIAYDGQARPVDLTDTWCDWGARRTRQCWSPKKSDSSSGSFSSLPKKYGGATPPLRQGSVGVHIYP